VRRVLAGFCAVVVLALVAAVGFHVIVAQSQLQLDRLEGEVTTEQERYQRLRAGVAALSSPDRITNRAAELGLVPSEPPAGAVAVPGRTGTSPPPPADTTGETLATSWETVKPHLDESR
jgi:hypothetical protein